MITNKGVSEFKIPASELSIFFSIAIAKRKAGKKFPRKSERITKGILPRGISLIWYTANGKNISPAEKIRMEPICQPFSSLLLSFIKIKELPQITDKTIKIIQLIIFSFFILFAKVQKDYF